MTEYILEMGSKREENLNGVLILTLNSINITLFK